MLFYFVFYFIIQTPWFCFSTALVTWHSQLRCLTQWARWWTSKQYHTFFPTVAQPHGLVFVPRAVGLEFLMYSFRQLRWSHCVKVRALSSHSKTSTKCSMVLFWLFALSRSLSLSHTHTRVLYIYLYVFSFSAEKKTNLLLLKCFADARQAQWWQSERVPADLAWRINGRGLD